MDDQNQVLKIVQQGFHMTLGAISVATETLQDEQKRAQLVSELSEQLTQSAQQWEEKGEETAEQARRVVEDLINQGSSEPSTSTTESTSTSSETSGTVTVNSNDYPSRLQSLMDEVTTLKEEMNQFRQQSQN